MFLLWFLLYIMGFLIYSIIVSHNAGKNFLSLDKLFDKIFLGIIWPFVLIYYITISLPYDSGKEEKNESKRRDREKL